MKKFLIIFGLFLCVPISVNAASVVNTMTATVQIFPQLPIGIAITTTPTFTIAANPQTNQPAALGNWRSMSVDVVTLGNAGCGLTALTMQCWAMEENQFVGLFPLQVITGTTSTGITTTADLVWNKPITSCAPSNGWTWTVSNIAWPSIKCRFVGTGANSNDLMTAYYRLLTP